MPLTRSNWIRTGPNVKYPWGNVGVGATNTTLIGSSLTVYGAVATSVSTYNANSTLTGVNSIVLANAIAAPVYITLPSSTNITGRLYTVKKIDASANVVPVVTAVGNSIDGLTMKAVTGQYTAVRFASDGGNNWWTV